MRQETSTFSSVAGNSADVQGIRADGWLVSAMFLLLGISVLMVYSTTAVFSQETFGDPHVLIKRHLLHMAFGILAFVFASSIRPAILQQSGLPALIAALILQLLVLMPYVGVYVGGARRWIMLGELRLQPGEISKFLIVLYFASYIGRHKKRMGSFLPGVLIPGLILALFAALFLFEPDFGSTVVLFLVVASQLFTVSRMSHLLSVGGMAAAGLGGLAFTSPYRFKRIITFLDPFGDPARGGYQLIQSLIAVGSGGISGEGLGAGKQKLFYLPAAHTDFIFAVIAEELGMLGSLAVILIFMLVCYRGLRIARRLCREPFCCSLAVGCTFLIVVPAILNMGVVVGLLPTKGMVLPLIAYGGTAMIVDLAALGVLIRLSRVQE